MGEAVCALPRSPARRASGHDRTLGGPATAGRQVWRPGCRRCPTPRAEFFPHSPQHEAAEHAGRVSLLGERNARSRTAADSPPTYFTARPRVGRPIAAVNAASECCDAPRGPRELQPSCSTCTKCPDARSSPCSGTSGRPTGRRTSCTYVRACLYAPDSPLCCRRS
ncbi:hypothetical protein MRX96_030558 [Rhipicephalus microplus]